MNSKLTITIDESLIDKARAYAGKKGKSLSNIIEIYLKSLTNEIEKDEIEITPIVKSLMGSFKAPKNFNYKKEIKNRLSEKYLEHE